MDTALAFAVDATQGEVALVAGTKQEDAGLRALARAFAGNRHVRADFRGIGGPLVEPVMDPPEGPAMPAWFRHLIAVPSQHVSVAVRDNEGTGRAIVLSTDPRNEMLEVWNEFSSEMMLLLLLLCPGTFAILALLALSLRPLTALSKAMGTLGRGEYDVQLDERLPAELAPVARDFNLLAGRLAEAAEVNLFLAERLETVQELERRDLANDLHDEVGPYLFAMAIDAARMQRDAAAGRAGQLQATAAAIADTVSQTQQVVRGMLTRLRTFLPDGSGAEEGIEQLARFWRQRYPGTVIELDLSTDGEPSDGMISRTIFRIVQESLCNAFRHGEPTHVLISLVSFPESDLRALRHRLRVEDNGRGSAENPNMGFGLRGMAERVKAVGGELNIVTRPGGGFRIDAAMPDAAPRIPVGELGGVA